jgi:hypothetical protein
VAPWEVKVLHAYSMTPFVFLNCTDYIPIVNKAFQWRHPTDASSWRTTLEKLWNSVPTATRDGEIRTGTSECRLWRDVRCRLSFCFVGGGGGGSPKTNAPYLQIIQTSMFLDKVFSRSSSLAAKAPRPISSMFLIRTECCHTSALLRFVTTDVSYVCVIYFSIFYQLGAITPIRYVYQRYTSPYIAILCEKCI